MYSGVQCYDYQLATNMCLFIIWLISIQTNVFQLNLNSIQTNYFQFNLNLIEFEISNVNFIKFFKIHLRFFN